MKLPRDVAIKIMNQYHLIQEKKAKYAHIERDALIRLAQPRASVSPTMRTHRRGVSSSSSNGTATATTVNRKPAGGASTSASLAVRRDSNSNNPPNGLMMASPGGGLRDRQLADGCSPRSPSIPLSPLVSTSMRLAKSGDSQEILDERAGTPGFSSRPPSPVQEEPGDYPEERSSSETELLQPKTRRDSSSATDGGRPRTPRKRRQSAAHSERSATSSGGSAPQIGHPGVIRLYCTFVDKTSVCEWRQPCVHADLSLRS
jgi:3-phosphoinositide dependent protein kinase-1